MPVPEPNGALARACVSPQPHTRAHATQPHDSYRRRRAPPRCRAALQQLAPRLRRRRSRSQARPPAVAARACAREPRLPHRRSNAMAAARSLPTPCRWPILRLPAPVLTSSLVASCRPAAHRVEVLPRHASPRTRREVDDPARRARRRLCLSSIQSGRAPAQVVGVASTGSFACPREQAALHVPAYLGTPSA